VLKLNRERGMSIIYTSHYMEEVELLCNRVAIIDQGLIIALDTIKNLVAMLGGGIIQVGLKEVDEILLTQLSQLEAVKNATLASQPTDGQGEGAASESQIVKIEAENSRKAIVNVLGYMNDQDINITSLDILEPNLESVFLHLTGKKLRE
jgi:ABC-2 type transport system ATP-binding protein